MTCDINVLLFMFQQTHTLAKPAKRANRTHHAGYISKDKGRYPARTD